MDKSLLADHGHELAVAIPVVAETEEVEVPTVGILVDAADDGATARAGPNHATDADDRLLDALGLAGVEDGLRDGAIGPGEVPAGGVVDHLLVRRVEREREEHVLDDAPTGLHGEVTGASVLVAVGVPLGLDLGPAGVIAVHLDLEHLETGDVLHGLRLLRVRHDEGGDLVGQLALLDQPDVVIVTSGAENGVDDRLKDVARDAVGAEELGLLTGHGDSRYGLPSTLPIGAWITAYRFNHEVKCWLSRKPRAYHTI